MENFTIRKIELEDYKNVYNLLIKCSDETDFLACDSKERIEGGFTLEGTKKFVESMISGNSNIKQFLCFDGKIAIGMLGLHGQNRSRFSHRISLGMNVYREHWGKGIGTLLIQRGIEEFNSNDSLTKLELDVRADNERAIALYKKHGFEIEAEYKNFFLVDEIYYNAYHMVKFK